MVWPAVPPRLWIQPEVIHRFILSPVTEPLTVLTPCTARHVFHPIDPPAESNTQIWPSLVYRPGLDSHTGPCEKPAGTYDRSFSPVPSTLQGLDAPRLVRERCRQKDVVAAILPRCMLELGARIRHHRLVTSRIRAFDTFPLVHEAPPSTPCLVCMLSRPKAYFARAPFETCIRSSRGKSGL